MSGTPPHATVIVAARNSAPTIAACLRSLQAQDFASAEIILVDDGSDDDTAAIGRAAAVRVVRSPPVGASAARNIGIELARGDVIAFTDGDCIAAPGWLGALVKGLRTTGATGVGGRQVNVFPPAQQRLRAGFEAFFRVASVLSDYTRGDDRPRRVAHNASCCSAYRAEALRAVGGFTAGLWPGEDVDLDLRLAATGAIFFYVPGAVVHHHRPGTFAWFRRMMRRYGEAERRLVRRHGRARPVDHVPTVSALFVGLHLLYALPVCRPWLLGVDGMLLGAGVVGLALTTPLRLWPAVVAFGLAAVWEWHVGWWTSRAETA
ncbi:MAG: glycosyltransferase [Acidobacteria bacterium]|nr:glycosyltransferase [Acidobacteriota bacterium]